MLNGFVVPVEIGDCRDISEAAGDGLGIVERTLNAPRQTNLTISGTGAAPD